MNKFHPRMRVYWGDKRTNFISSRGIASGARGVVDYVADERADGWTDKMRQTDQLLILSWIRLWLLWTSQYIRPTYSRAISTRIN